MNGIRRTAVALLSVLALSVLMFRGLPAGAEGEVKLPSLRPGMCMIRFPSRYWFSPPPGADRMAVGVSSGLISAYEAREWSGPDSPGKLLEYGDNFSRFIYLSKLAGKKVFFWLFVKCPDEGGKPEVTSFALLDAQGNRATKTFRHEIGWFDLRERFMVRCAAPIMSVRVNFRRRTLNKKPSPFREDPKKRLTAEPPVVSRPDLYTVMVDSSYSFWATRQVRFVLELPEGFPLKGGIFVRSEHSASPIRPFFIAVTGIKVPARVAKLRLVADECLPVTDLSLHKEFPGDLTSEPTVAESQITLPDGAVRKAKVYECTCAILMGQKQSLKHRGYAEYDVSVWIDEFLVSSEKAAEAVRWIYSFQLIDEEGRVIGDLVKMGMRPFGDKEPDLRPKEKRNEAKGAAGAD